MKTNTHRHSLTPDLDDLLLLSLEKIPMLERKVDAQSQLLLDYQRVIQANKQTVEDLNARIDQLGSQLRTLGASLTIAVNLLKRPNG
jgi:hypothetical protein